MAVCRMLISRTLIDGATPEKILSAIQLEEVLEILSTRRRLRACKTIVGDMVNRSEVLETHRLISEDPVLMDHVLGSAFENSAENLKRDQALYHIIYGLSLRRSQGRSSPIANGQLETRKSR